MEGPSDSADFDPDLPWPLASIAELGRPELEEILRFNYGIDTPTDIDVVRLRQQLAELQQNPPLHGTLRWVEQSEDELVLYDPDRASSARRVEELASSTGTWGELRTAMAEGGDTAEFLIDCLDLLWENERYWAFGLEDDDPRIEQAESFKAFLAMPARDETLDIILESEGEPTLFMCDPMDPVAMGVPPVIVERYYEEQWNMVSSWSSVPVEALPDVQRTLRALGWALEKGTSSDLPGG